MSPTARLKIAKPWALPADEVLAQLEVDPQQGLSRAEVRRRGRGSGSRPQHPGRGQSAWKIFAEQFQSLSAILLLGAAALAFSFADALTGFAIVITLILNVLIGFVTQLRAVRSLEAFYGLRDITARVKRDGQIKEVAAEELVPGDIVRLESGETVPADLRLFEASELAADETALTGASDPVAKGVEAVSEGAPPGQRNNLAFKGTAVTHGAGAGVVVAAGPNTVWGRVSARGRETRVETTALVRRLAHMGYRLIWLTLAMGLVVAITGFFTHQGLFLVGETAIALAVAAIPEGLVIAATLALARGVRRLARSGVMVNRLSALEPLGATSVVLTDDIGSLAATRQKEQASTDQESDQASSALAACREAGIRVIMATGDEPESARRLARAAGLIKDGEAGVIPGSELKDPDTLSAAEQQQLARAAVFAPVSAGQKADIIALHQEDGVVMAMTGDGVLDAPALKQADIGIIRGQQGATAARPTADLIIAADDSLDTVVKTVAGGRTIFGNIRKFLLFLLSGNVSEILIVTVAWLAGAPLPVTPLQILYLNTIGDIFPALALGLGKGSPETMKRPPRAPQEPFLGRLQWLSIGFYGVLIAAVVLATFVVTRNWLGMDLRLAVTSAFMTLAFSRLGHVFNMREVGSRLIFNEIILNPYIWGAEILCTGLLTMMVYVPVLIQVFKVTDPGGLGWLVITVASVLPCLIGQCLKVFGVRWTYLRLLGESINR